MKQLVTQINKYNEIHFLIKNRKLQESYRLIQDIKLQTPNWLCIILNLYAQISLIRQQPKRALASLESSCEIEAQSIIICLSYCNLIQVYLKLQKQSQAANLARKILPILENYLSQTNYNKKVRQISMKIQQMLTYVYLVLLRECYCINNISSLKNLFQQIKKLDVLTQDEFKKLDHIEQLEFELGLDINKNMNQKKKLIDYITKFIQDFRGNSSSRYDPPIVSSKSVKKKMRVTIKKSNTVERIVSAYLDSNDNNIKTAINFKTQNSSSKKRILTSSTKKIQQKKKILLFSQNPIYKESLVPSSIFKIRKPTIEKPRVSNFLDNVLVMENPLIIRFKKKKEEAQIEQLKPRLQNIKEEKGSKEIFSHEIINDEIVSNSQTNQKFFTDSNMINKINDNKQQFNHPNPSVRQSVINQQEKIDEAMSQDFQKYSQNEFDLNYQIEWVTNSIKLVHSKKIQYQNTKNTPLNCYQIIAKFLDQITDARNKKIMAAFLWLLEKTIQENYSKEYCKTNNAEQLPKLAKCLVSTTREKYFKQIPLDQQNMIKLTKIFFKWLQLNHYTHQSLDIN